MCIAIFLPAGKELTEEILNNCYESNKDGFGFSWFDNHNNLQIVKTADKDEIKMLINSFCKFRRRYMNKHFIVHFRIATHGKIMAETCHPFKVNKDLVFAHNGILQYNYGVDIKSSKSDTMMFNETILKRLPKNFIYKPELVELLEGYIGYGNKMIFLNSKNDYLILNEGAGTWDKGVWYSNGSYRRQKFLFTDTQLKGWSWVDDYDDDKERVFTDEKGNRFIEVS